MRGKTARARAVVAAVVAASVVAGLALHAGWGTLSSMGWNVVAAICPLGALETLVAARTMVPRAAVALALAVLVALLAGRVFCGWVCPVPHVSAFFHPRKAGKGGGAGEACASGTGDSSGTSGAPRCAGCAGCALPPMGGARDGLRLDSRHGVLAAAIVGSLAFGFPVFCLVCPVGLTFGLVVAVWHAFAEQTPTLSLLVFPLILGVELVAFRKWCHVLCPMGALMSLLGARAPVFRPHVDENACLRAQGRDCRVCVEACPERLDPHAGRLPECTRCGECAERCPAHAISLPLLPKRSGGPTEEVPR